MEPQLHFLSYWGLLLFVSFGLGVDSPALCHKVIYVTDGCWHPQPDPHWPTSKPYQTRLQRQSCHRHTRPKPRPLAATAPFSGFPGLPVRRGESPWGHFLPSPVSRGILCKSFHLWTYTDLTSRFLFNYRITDRLVLYTPTQKALNASDTALFYFVNPRTSISIKFNYCIFLFLINKFFF